MEFQLNQITLLVSDMQASVHFYRDRLGRTAQEVSEQGSEFRAGAVTIALHPGQTDNQSSLRNGTDAGTMNTVLKVANLSSCVQTLCGRGVEVSGPHEMEGLPPLANFTDPDGISFTLTEEVES